MGKKVMAAGHICLDITPKFHAGKTRKNNSLFLPGKLVNVGAADISLGGSVANTGLAMNFLGADVRLVAKLGIDPFGKIVREKLRKHKAELCFVNDKESSTSYSVVIAPPGVDRIFLHDPGTNDTFCAEDIAEEFLEEIVHFHFGYPTLMRRMYEDGGRELASILAMVKRHGITTSMDMAAIDPASPAGKADWRAILALTLPQVDIFLPSAEEICFMLDRKRYDEWNARTAKKQGADADVMQVLDIEKDIKPLAIKLLELGAKTVIIKCGAKGIFYKSSGDAEMRKLVSSHRLKKAEWCDLEGFEPSYLQPNIVSGTGAGDTSIAAFLVSMLDGYSLDRCVKLAAATGACCISAYDALSGLEPLDRLWKRIEDGWEKNNRQNGG